MIPKNITRDHILNAIKTIDINGVPPQHQSRKYQLFYNRKYYPPKYVISIANRLVSGYELDASEFGGGDETNDYLRNHGFKIYEIRESDECLDTPTNTNRSIPSAQQIIKHDERCANCKNTIQKMLVKLYGSVIANYDLRFPTNPEDYKNTGIYQLLIQIYMSLQNYRGHTNFVQSLHLYPVDYYIPQLNVIVEFDESQHFTTCRKLSLIHYPDDLLLGFSKRKWIQLCDFINKKDNDPIFRDEQRAWYDCLRDIAPIIYGMKSTVRLYASDRQWCKLNCDDQSDLEIFRSIIENPSEYKRAVPVNEGEKNAPGTQSNFRIALVFPEITNNNPSKITDSKDFQQEKTDLIVFPESYIDFDNYPCMDNMQNISDELDTPVLSGVSKLNLSRAASYETMVLFKPGVSHEILYYKHSHAEAVAFEHADWSPEKYLSCFDIKGVRIGCTICHDSYLGLLQKYLAKQGIKMRSCQ